MIKIKRVLRYLKGTTFGLTYSEDAENGDELTAYVDADHAGDMDKEYSTTGCVLSRSAYRLEVGETNGCVCVCSGIGVCSIVESVPNGSVPQALTENDK